MGIGSSSLRFQQQHPPGEEFLYHGLPYFYCRDIHGNVHEGRNGGGVHAKDERPPASPSQHPAPLKHHEKQPPPAPLRPPHPGRSASLPRENTGEKIGGKIDDALDQRPGEKIRDAVEDAKE